MFLTLSDMSLIRGTSLQGFTELVIELGGDPATLIERAGLEPESIGNHDSFISYRSVITVLEAAAQATRVGDFGRRLATRQGIEILGPLGLAARTAPTVGDALQAVERYMDFYSPALGVSVRVEEGNAVATYGWDVVADRPPPHRQAAELGLGVSVRVFRLLAGPDFRPVSVQLKHDALGDVDSYATYFGCRVEFSADEYGFRFARNVLARRLEADSLVHAVARDYLNTIAVPAEANAAESVTRLVRRLLPTGGLDLSMVADQLAQHRRTVQRQLAAQGTTFASVVDDVRRQEADRRLRETDMPLGQISGLLGFSEQSAFTRACRRWFDAPPRAVRARARGGPVDSMGNRPGPPARDR